MFDQDTTNIALLDLINAVVKSDGLKFTKIERRESEVPRQAGNGVPKITMDICGTLEDGTIVDIEMQTTSRGKIVQRSAYYASRLYSKQDLSHSKYDKLNPVICIWFLTFDNIGEESSKYVHLRKNNNIIVETSEILTTRTLSEHFVSLKAIEYHPSTKKYDARLQEWIKFLNSPEEFAKTADDVFKKMYDCIETVNTDKYVVEEVKRMVSYIDEVRNDAQERGEAIGIMKGEAIGIMKGEAIGIMKGEAIGIMKGEAIGKIKAFLSIGYTPTQIAQHLNENLEQILDIIDSFKTSP
ncbi:MAG: hypothetical protein ATN36_00825 [Epulopiscium sp. Nele67-Bin005]|nr:MAG: hypothetical protein ATN36_00825 [Epulopiscium sp. Nele67-Bin005]